MKYLLLYHAKNVEGLADAKPAMDLCSTRAQSHDHEDVLESVTDAVIAALEQMRGWAVS